MADTFKRIRTDKENQGNKKLRKENSRKKRKEFKSVLHQIDVNKLDDDLEDELMSEFDE